MADDFLAINKFTPDQVQWCLEHIRYSRNGATCLYCGCTTVY